MSGTRIRVRAASGALATVLLAAVSIIAMAGSATAGTVPYALPWLSGKSFSITQSPGGSYSHTNQYNRTAVDFGLPVGTPVVASQSGTVYFEGWNGLAGIEARIDHGSNSCTQYAHLNRTIVDKGQRVLRGQVIGYSGGSSNGSQTGVAPHLHWAGIYCSTGVSKFVVSTTERGTRPSGSHRDKSKCRRRHEEPPVGPLSGRQGRLHGERHARATL